MTIVAATYLKNKGKADPLIII